jgi:hypothetical protein
MFKLGQILQGLKNLGTPVQRPVLPLDEALRWLVPKVRPRFRYETRAIRQVATCPVFRPLAGLFGMSLVVDFPDGELDVGPRELAAWGVAFDLLLQRARTNLLARGGDEAFREVRAGLFRSPWRDNLDGSRVLLPGLLKRLPLQGDPVVVLPNPDTLLVAGSEDPEGLTRLMEAAVEFLHEDRHARNACPLRLKNFLWEPFTAPQGHPAAPLLARIHRRRLLEEYGRQKHLLDRIHDLAGSAVTVAPLHLERASSGAVTVRTFWHEGQGEGWLPEAEQVGLVRDEDCLWVTWSQARRHLGHLLEPMGLFPERYRILGFPSQDLMAKMAIETRAA